MTYFLKNGSKLEKMHLKISKSEVFLSPFIQVKLSSKNGLTTGIKANLTSEYHNFIRSMLFDNNNMGDLLAVPEITDVKAG